MRSVTAEAAQVRAVADDAVDTAEQYMLEQILRPSDVKDREHWDLAVTLFREFDQSVEMDDKLDRIAELISRLMPLCYLSGRWHVRLR